MNYSKRTMRTASIALVGASLRACVSAPIDRIQLHGGEWIHPVYGRLAIEVYEDGTAHVEGEKLSVESMTVCPEDGATKVTTCPTQTSGSSDRYCRKDFSDFHLFGIGSIRLDDGSIKNGTCVFIALNVSKSGPGQDTINVRATFAGEDPKPPPGVGGTPRPTSIGRGTPMLD